MKIFIQRKDGVIQRYNVSAKNRKKLESSVRQTTYKKTTRKRRVYFSKAYIRKVQKASTKAATYKKQKIISENAHYKKLRQITVSNPIVGEIGQLHMTIKVDNKLSEGYSLLRKLEIQQQREKAFQEALAHALSKVYPYSGDNYFSIEAEHMEYDIVAIDYVYFIQK